MNLQKIFLSIFIFFTFLSINLSLAQEAVMIEHKQETFKAEVLRVISGEVKNIPGTELSNTYQKIEVKILEGSQKGRIVEVNNDHLNLKQGEIFYLQYTSGGYGELESYVVIEPYRIPILLAITILFIISVIIFGGKQGMRGLLSLMGSLFIIFLIMFPAILKGYSPILISILISSFIIILGSYITHGFNRTTTSSVVGMIITILITGVLAMWSTQMAKLSGFSDEAATYLNFATKGGIDFVGLLLGGIMIGLLGVLYDAAIGQAVSVEELSRVGKNLSKRYIFNRSIRIGREHIGALVNTLAIAYVGASLPLLLLMYTSSESILTTINREVFATEIVRTMIGSIGLVLAVPITTLVSIFIILKDNKNKDENKVEHEKYLAENIKHTCNH